MSSGWTVTAWYVVCGVTKVISPRFRVIWSIQVVSDFFGDFGGTKNGTSGGPRSTKLVGTIRVTKKITHIDNGPGRNYGETVILHILASFLECKTAIFFKSFAMCHFTVYNAEFLSDPGVPGV